MRSMTGFGRAERRCGEFLFTVEVKSVNHRYLDTRFRLPPALSLCEFSLLEMIRALFERGAFEVSVKQRLATTDNAQVSTGTRFVVDEGAAESLAKACDWLHFKYRTPEIPSLEAIAFTQKVFIPVEDSRDPKELWTLLHPIANEAMGELKKMRESEGTRLKALLISSLTELSGVIDGLHERAGQQAEKIRERLKTRIAQWGLGSAVEPQRLEWEVAFYADRSDITEELGRLKAHLKEFHDSLDSPKPIGRKLDFLTQELNREMNTIASKADDWEMTRLVISGKSTVEKLREQVQNVE